MLLVLSLAQLFQRLELAISFHQGPPPPSDLILELCALLAKLRKLSLQALAKIALRAQSLQIDLSGRRTRAHDRLQLDEPTLDEH